MEKFREEPKANLPQDINEPIDLGDFEEEAGNIVKKRKSLIQFPRRWQSRMKRSKKTGKQVLVLFIDNQHVVRKPILVPLIPQLGTAVKIRTSFYKLDPRSTLTFEFSKNKTCKGFIIKEWDRLPVSSLDYEIIKKEGRNPELDGMMVQACIQAKAMDGLGKKASPKMIAIVVGVIVIAIIGYIMFSGTV